MSEEFEQRETESINADLRDLDLMSVAELAERMNREDTTVPAAVASALPQIVPAIERAAERMAAGGRLVYVGSGTSGRIGVLDASECPPTFGSPPEQVFAIIAGGPDAVLAAKEGAEDDASAGSLAMDDAGIGVLDTVIGIASSGSTPFVVAAVIRARELGATTVGLACSRGSALADAAEYPIEVIVGPELLAGSTRLKAGTAQKLVVNMFSTITMVSLGKTYGNLMVDMRATNTKLRDRAARMVAEIADIGVVGVDRDAAQAALVTTDWDVKAAVLVLRKGLGPDDAVRLLSRHGGRLRAALEAE